MSDDPKDAILCQWAGCPGFFPEFSKPCVRAIMLKGSGAQDLHVDAWALIGLTLFAMTIAVTRFRRTLD